MRLAHDTVTVRICVCMHCHATLSVPKSIERRAEQA